ncbi:MAG TPA: flagellar biosynthetic protein FliR [Nevskiaceae bacterium]|nr:flagellar biosynthetic protein FliR [Nevskiaceae bacterium]
MTAWLASLVTLLTAALLPLLRVSSLMVTAPLFSATQVPARFKALFAVVLTAIIAPLQAAPPALLSPAWWDAAVGEIAIGLLIGFGFKLVFEGISMGAEAAAGASGLSFAQLADPVDGAPTAAVGSLYAILATLAFLALDGHLLLIQVLTESFSFSTNPIVLLHAVLGFGAHVLAAGVLLAAPVIAASLGVYLAMGAVSKAAPALNLFAVGFPAALLVALIAIGWSLNGIPGTLQHFTDQAASLVAPAQPDHRAR